eukprot:TRINITY_DN46203_c0_g1_i1.p1 TRINITY_DN46203_c0_g1~~TRINITY_DN46203_c0_g1_i1.p1  ORF type:complete len:206 (+),score=47.51 TRINITY_DN46203_c0_g1_i1:87-704(+)
MANPTDLENQYEGANRIRNAQHGRRRKQGDVTDAVAQPPKKMGWGESEGGSTTEVDVSTLKTLQAAYFGDDEDAAELAQSTNAAGGASALAADERPINAEEMATKVAEVTTAYEAAKLPALDDLDKEREYKLPTVERDLDIDITLLTKALTPGSVAEEDKTWDPALLFTELASTLQAEREALAHAQAVALAMERAAQEAADLAAQ